MKFKAWKFLAPALALFAAATFFGCDSGGNTINWYYPTSQESGEYPASQMTQTQTAAASGSPITVDPTTKTLVLSGVSGKTIYMARTNPKNRNLSGKLTRAAQIASDVSSSVAEGNFLAEGAKSAQVDAAAQAFGLPDFETAKETDPHARIYQAFLDELKAAKSAGVSKSLAPAQISAATTYSVGDEVDFNSANPESFSSNTTFSKRTFKLLVSETDYNVWVHTSDTYYKKDTGAFTTAAIKLGTNFINGYGLVSHLYGQPADKIYDRYTGNPIGPMSSVSKTGTKINIMLYSMLEQGKVYGFVYHGDVFNTDDSNQGRFVYMDTKTLLEAPMEAYSTALHEFSHTISFNQKTILNNKEWTYWYGELLAMTCEDMMQNYLGILDSQTGDGENMSHTPKGRIPEANYLGWYNGISGGDALAYASIFQFAAWLSRNFGGAKFIKELATNAYVDMESVLNAVNAMGKGSYTQTTLLQKFAGDMLVAESGKGFYQSAATYTGNAAYTCPYTDESDNPQTYNYPLTAINLWDNFYGWCDTKGFSKYISNQSILFSQLPGANLYKKATWEGTKPTTAYLGPILFNTGLFYSNIGPYGSMLFKLGTADSDTVTINFSCVGGVSFSDTVTIYAK